MEDQLAKSDKSFHKDSKKFVLLIKDERLICRTVCSNPPENLAASLKIQDLVRQSKQTISADSLHFYLHPAAECLRDEVEWKIFLSYLRKWNKVAIAKSSTYMFYIHPPKAADANYLRVSYNQVKKYLWVDPSYLKALGHAHSGWLFGAIAEFVDNSLDAKAKRLDISVDVIYSKREHKRLPVLSITDDGSGMTHQEIVRMICLGLKKPDTNDVDRIIGRFGVGFKNGAMRLGKDALVITQTAKSRSIAFLSQSLNEGNNDLEIPIITYRREGQLMEIDTSVQSEASAKHNLKAVKEFSHFDEYLIGEKVGLFGGNLTGTQVYIWNLDEWGTNYSLEWTTEHHGDILIRSRRVRSRPGQMSQKVPLDYSLRSYLEVIYLVPRMRIYVQGSLVKTRPLALSLNKTCEETGTICGKSVHLTLGRCRFEWKRGNGGMFLYWRGRLIEAYKRVGGMVHSGVVGRGLIGVIDVTDLMDGDVSVHSNKQCFLDCEAYARLEEWLGKKADAYWDKHFDAVELKKGGIHYKPDHEWVQCSRCRKWRMLTYGFDSKILPLDWFCYMDPYAGSCDTPEQKYKRGVITISTKRIGYAYPEL